MIPDSHIFFNPEYGNLKYHFSAAKEKLPAGFISEGFF